MVKIRKMDHEIVDLKEANLFSKIYKSEENLYEEAGVKSIFLRECGLKYEILTFKMIIDRKGSIEM